MLRVDQVQVFYGRQQRLFDVSLAPVEEGDVIGLLGPNGAGKSTLMRALAGLQKYQGNIEFHSGQQQQLAYMPQNPPQESSLLPYELLWSAIRSLGLPWSDQQLAQRIEVLFQRLGLNEVAMSPMYSLSGGKRQLVGLALTMIRDPLLMLLDEPTSALDLHWRMVVLDLVQSRVREQGGMAIAALHDLDLAARYCNKLVLLKQGRIVAAGSVAEVLTPDNMAQAFSVEARIETGSQGFPMVEVIRPL